MATSHSAMNQSAPWVWMAGVVLVCVTIFTACAGPSDELLLRRFSQNETEYNAIALRMVADTYTDEDARVFKDFHIRENEILFVVAYYGGPGESYSRGYIYWEQPRPIDDQMYRQYGLRPINEHWALWTSH